MDKPLVSIIIPTYNRAHLIGETLDSVIAQTFTNWECIVVDDGSSDHTDEVLNKYCNEDSRIKFFHRPKEYLFGGNGSRNYGFKKSKGEYINWFDSDDIMFYNFIKEKVSLIRQYDFLATKSVNVFEDGSVAAVYNFDGTEKITFHDFIVQKIGWITNDFFVKKSSLRGLIFNEKLKSGQEYNFFSRYLEKNTNGLYVNQQFSERKIHGTSIQSGLSNLKIKFKELVCNEILLFNDLNMNNQLKYFNHFSKRILRYSYYYSDPFSLNLIQIKALLFLFNQAKYRESIKFFSWIILNLFFGRGYFLYKTILKK
jgi:glycosyltransferase involved in cell wall biosynthesis